MLLGAPRFGHETPDSPSYIKVAQYFRGEVELGQLRAPFAYRVVLPWLASQLPIKDLHIAFASLNIGFVITSYFLLLTIVGRLTSQPRAQTVSALLLVCSFPTLNYASGVLTDPALFFWLVASTWAFLSGRLLLLTLAVLIGTLTRESAAIIAIAAGLNLIVAGTPRGRYLSRFVCVTLAAGMGMLLPRIYLSDLPTFLWFPDSGRVFANLARPVSWATCFITAAPLLTAFVVSGHRTSWQALRKPSADIVFLLCVAAASTLLFLYSIVAAFMSGRFFWPLYIALVPLTALSCTHERGNVVTTLADRLFGATGPATQ